MTQGHPSHMLAPGISMGKPSIAEWLRKMSPVSSGFIPVVQTVNDAVLPHSSIEESRRRQDRKPHLEAHGRVHGF